MRKLLCIACGYAGALLAAHYFLPWEWILPAGGVFALLACLALLLRGRVRRAALLLLLAAAVGCGWYSTYYRMFLFPAEKLDGETQTVTVRVAAYAAVYPNYSSVAVRCVDAAVPRVRMLVYDYQGNLGRLRPGDIVQMPLKLKSAGTRYEEKSDAYYSDGVFLRGTLNGDAVVTGRARLAWMYFPQEAAECIRRQAESCFPNDVSGIMQAMLTGSRQAYYKDDALSAAMKTAGFSHIVAVSGMHMAFLVGALRMLLGRRRRTAFICIPAIIIFMAMTGFSPSVVRAGIMQILLLTASVLRRENDPLTALSAAVLLMLWLNPLSIGSCALQLSVSATAGLILITPAINARLCTGRDGKARFRNGWRGRAARWICATFSASVGALVFTTPISALWFGFVPLYSVLTNCLCLWAMSVCFLLGYPVCILGMIRAPLGQAAGWCVSWFARYAIFMVKQIASLPMAAVYTRGNLGAWWLVFTYLIFFGAYFLRGKAAFRPLIPFCASVIGLLLIALFPEHHFPGCMEFSVLDVGQGQSIAVLLEHGTVVIDCGSSSGENAGEIAAEYLLRAGRRQVDLLVMTHFHADHANGVERLMNSTKVLRLAYPEDCEENEYLTEILAACEKRGTELFRITENTEMAVDNLSLRLYAPPEGGDSNERCMFIQGGYGEFDFLVTGDAGEPAEHRLLSAGGPGDLELLVVGHHGSRYSTGEELLDAVTPETAVISVGAHNSYGHPTEEVLERLAQRDIEVHRTDLDGTVSVTVGETYGEKGKNSF